MDSKTIAIIEDEMPIAQMYRMKLQLAGYKVEIASDGRRGLDMIKKIRPDLVLLDIMMPYMDGDEVLRRMRDDLTLTDIPVIIITNIGNTELQEKIEKFGVADYIQKSDLTPRQVLAKIDKVMGIERTAE